MDVLIDSNIILDWLQRRTDFYENARRIMEHCIFGETNAYVTSHSLCDIFYILRKDFSAEERMSLIRLLSERFFVITEDKTDFYNATESSFSKDLEDSLQMACASRMKLDYIVTRNIKDFENSETPVIEPSEFLKLVER